MNSVTGYRAAGRRGGALVYMTVSMVVFVGVVSFAVDWGRVQLAKTELSHAADAAAMAGASVVTNGAYYVRNEATRIGAMNSANGKPVLVLPGDVLIGKWDGTTRLLDTTSASPDAVQVTTYLTTARDSAIQLSLAGAVSPVKLAQATRTTTAVWVKVPGIYQQIQATANPFLANMPKGSKASDVNPHNSPDKAGDPTSDKPGDWGQSPLPAGEGGTRMGVTGGMTFNFDSISGDARHDPNLPFFAPDGELGDIGHNNLTKSSSNSYGTTLYHQNGIHDVIAPINALVGIFLTDEAPDRTPVPTVDRYDADAPYDYTRPEERNRLTYKPKLKQIFFIGDGMTDDRARQAFVAPPGATRLYLATWDFYEWNNNAGQRLVQINGSGYVKIVK